MEASNICSKVILPFCPSYPEARQLFNRALKAGQSIRIRSGGHNYEGFCIGDNKLTIDTSQMKNIKLNGSIIKIGSGISNKELYEFLRQYGYPFPSGTCPTVSAAGLTQGGGWGHSSRMLGLACDSLTQVQLVDARGRFITASQTSHPNLFWALRGGGAVTSES